jgi:hypothetical protein
MVMMVSKGEELKLKVLKESIDDHIKRLLLINH